MKTIFHLFFILITINLTAQESILSAKVDFKDGVYLSYNDFAQNSPSLNASEITYQTLSGAFPFQRYLHSFKPSPDIAIDMDTFKIWGVCINGIPYVNQTMVFKIRPQYVNDFYNYTLSQETQIFAKIMMIGHLCHFTAYWEADRNIMDDFLYDKDDYKLKSLQQFLIKASTGEIEKCNPSKFELLIKDDKELYQKYLNLSMRKKDKELFSFYREYNLKNPIILKTIEVSR